jgi:sulfopyruvate decarboxylase TPP-binding subunit
MRVADAVVDILKSEGVKFVAALPGDDILPLFDAFHQQDDIPLILTRHEQATVFMADGYARSCGEPGVAMVTKGPGRCNAFTAIVNAFTDCVPLVVIFGHSSRKQLAKGMLQEVPYLDTFQTVAKWTFSIPSPERVPEVFRRAFTLARSGRPGPVIIEIPQDISMVQADIPPYTKTRRVRFGPDPYDIDKVARANERIEAPADLRGTRGALVWRDGGSRQGCRSVCAPGDGDAAGEGSHAGRSSFVPRARRLPARGLQHRPVKEIRRRSGSGHCFRLQFSAARDFQLVAQASPRKARASGHRSSGAA